MKPRFFKLKKDETAIAYGHDGFVPHSLVIKKKDFAKMADAMLELMKSVGVKGRIEKGISEEFKERVEKNKQKPVNVLAKPIPKGR